MWALVGIRTSALACLVCIIFIYTLTFLNRQAPHPQPPPTDPLKVQQVPWQSVPGSHCGPEGASAFGSFLWLFVCSITNVSYVRSVMKNSVLWGMAYYFLVFIRDTGNLPESHLLWQLAVPGVSFLGEQKWMFIDQEVKKSSESKERGFSQKKGPQDVFRLPPLQFFFVFFHFSLLKETFLRMLSGISVMATRHHNVLKGPSIQIVTICIPFGVTGSLEPVPDTPCQFVTGLPITPTHTLTKWPINLWHTFLDGGRKPEYPEKTH